MKTNKHSQDTRLLWGSSASRDLKYGLSFFSMFAVSGSAVTECCYTLLLSCFISHPEVIAIQDGGDRNAPVSALTIEKED